MQYSISTKAHLLNTDPSKISHDSNYYHEVLTKLTEHANNAEQSIDERIEEMQEAFLKIFDYIMNEEKISRQEKIIISLTEKGTLEVNEHSERKRIMYALSQNPQTLKIMQRLAADALLKRGIQNIKYANTMPTNGSQSDKLSDKFIYQTSIKGALSHFYLV